MKLYKPRTLMWDFTVIVIIMKAGLEYIHNSTADDFLVQKREIILLSVPNIQYFLLFSRKCSVLS